MKILEKIIIGGRNDKYQSPKALIISVTETYVSKGALRLWLKLGKRFTWFTCLNKSFLYAVVPNWKNPLWHLWEREVYKYNTYISTINSDVEETTSVYLLDPKGPAYKKRLTARNAFAKTSTFFFHRSAQDSGLDIFTNRMMDFNFFLLQSSLIYSDGYGLEFPFKGAVMGESRWD